MSITATTLSAAIDSTQTRFNVASTTGITAPNNQTGSGITYLYLGSEMMLVTAIPVSGTVDVLRGQLGSRAQSHGASEPVLAGAPTDFPSFQPTQGVEVQANNRYLGCSAPVAAAATITPSGKIFHVTGTTATSKINAPSSDFIEGQFTVIADGAWTWTSGSSAGSIAQAGAVTSAGTTVTFTYDAATQLWYASRQA